MYCKYLKLYFTVILNDVAQPNQIFVHFDFGVGISMQTIETYSFVLRPKALHELTTQG